ncbi:hypothetical protein Trco_005928 [Trichoderma cornu-damae]|uniref:DASH complex subunit DAD4 n=1 Tax=Trichoderma cornu-damae TaxID=654480 RepID=A0A9P8QK01_9HYPO|nr:hypothetical protein Trco_005928 [Trichoderma cornu-damae]
MANYVYQLERELQMLNQSIIAINEGLLSLDTALQNETRPAEAMRLVRETTAYAISLVHAVYPILGSMRNTVHILNAF